MELVDKENKEFLWVGNIYGPIIQAQKETFWNSLEYQMIGKKQSPHIIASDFNVTISSKECMGGSKIKDPFGERMEDLISLWGLSEIKPKNGNFTQNNKKTGLGHIAARLDRVLINTYILKSLDVPVRIINPPLYKFGHMSKSGVMFKSGVHPVYL